MAGSTPSRGSAERGPGPRGRSIIETGSRKRKLRIPGEPGRGKRRGLWTIGTAFALMNPGPRVAGGLVRLPMGQEPATPPSTSERNDEPPKAGGGPPEEGGPPMTAMSRWAAARLASQ